MLLSEFLQTRNIGVNQNIPVQGTLQEQTSEKVNSDGRSFSDELRELLQGSGVQFSNHAIKRLESRDIDVTENDVIERLNKGVELAAQKGCGQSLILIDSNAYIVSVANNKVITTVSQNDLKENVFTNIDSTVIV